VSRNEVRFKSVLEAEAGKLWEKEGSGGRNNPCCYRWVPTVTHPGKEEGGDE
jgi:hypothetical protein